MQVSLEKPDGTVLASRTVTGSARPGRNTSSRSRTPAGIADSTDNRIVVSLESDGRLTEQDV